MPVIDFPEWELDDYEDYDDYEEERTPENDFEIALNECGLMPGGWCSYAGSEYCDWDCPLNYHMTDEEIGEFIEELKTDDDTTDE